MTSAHSKKARFTRFLFLGVVFSLLLSLVACKQTSKVQPVSPVTGLPQGTNGFPWWNDAVFYEIFIRSFYDTNGDGIGDIAGLMEKLDYLNDGNPETTTDLGITGLWLMPIHPSPSYHGYDVKDYYDINPQYGSLEEFKNLVTEAHQRGIRVIIDLVMNHTSTGHPWFVEAKNNPASPYRDWYIWSDQDPRYLGPWGQDVWYRTDTGYYYAIFWEGMPDLNYTNPEVVAEMEKVAHFWLQDVGVDGFRLDAAKHIVEEGEIQENADANHEWWEEFRRAYKASNPQAMTVGEVWSGTDQIKKYLEGDELDLAFDFDLATAIVSGAGTLSANTIKNGLNTSLKSFPEGQYAVFLTNHDQDRAMNKMLNDPNRAKLAASVLLTIPGVPFIYYGEEIGMMGVKPDENLRTPMQWSAEVNSGFSAASYPWRPVNSDFKEKNVEIQSADPESLLSHYRELIHLRNQHVALRVGEFIPVDCSDRRVMAFLRSSQEESVLVILSFHKEALEGITFSLQGSALAGEYKVVPMLFAGGPEKPGKFSPLVFSETGGFEAYPLMADGQSLPEMSTLILQLQPEK